MNIIIQGDQAQGKTTKAKVLAKTYDQKAVLWVNLSINSLSASELTEVLKRHILQCAYFTETPPLFVFDDLSRKHFRFVSEVMRLARIQSRGGQVDAIYITNEPIDVT